MSSIGRGDVPSPISVFFLYNEKSEMKFDVYFRRRCLRAIRRPTPLLQVPTHNPNPTWESAPCWSISGYTPWCDHKANERDYDFIKFRLSAMTEIRCVQSFSSQEWGAILRCLFILGLITATTTHRISDDGLSDQGLLSCIHFIINFTSVVNRIHRVQSVSHQYTTALFEWSSLQK